MEFKLAMSPAGCHYFHGDPDLHLSRDTSRPVDIDTARIAGSGEEQSVQITGTGHDSPIPGERERANDDQHVLPYTPYPLAVNFPFF